MTAIEELFSEYYKDIFRYLYSLCRDVSLSEDLASEVFLEAVKSVTTFRAKSDVKTWLFSISRHRWFKYLQKKKRTIQATEIYDLVDLEHPNAVSAEESAIKKELAERVYSIIEAEPERSRNVALMRIDGYSFYEIGKALEISESSARVIFFRIREKIRKKIKEEGFDYE